MPLPTISRTLVPHALNQNFPHTIKRTWTYHSLISPLSSPWKQLIYFLFLWIFLFWKFHINGIIQYVTFCDWLLSLNIMFTRFIYVVACVQFSSVQLLNHVRLFETPWTAARKASYPSPTPGACSNSYPLSR